MSALDLVSSLISSFNTQINEPITSWFKHNINNKLQYNTLEQLAVDNQKSPQNNRQPRQLSNTCYTKVNPTPLPSPTLLSYSNNCLRQCLNLNIDHHSHKDEIIHIMTQIVNGDMKIINKYLPDCQPYSHRYAGKQFGSYAGQLGDGRALTLGHLNGYELQLKGSGKTPFSRFGDGRAVLFSSIREFLCSEAMYNLNIPTSRGAVLVTSHKYEVLREQQIEPTAILLRLSKGFIRFGSFETCYIDNNKQHLIDLLHFVMNNYYQDIVDKSENMYEIFWKKVVDMNVKLAVMWQAIGFVHGVLNTDNMSIIAETIDYGPYGFIEYFDENFIPNHSDWNGRYSWFTQPSVIKWNLQQLALALNQIGVLPIKTSLKYLERVSDTKNDKNAEEKHTKSDEFPFQATVSKSHFDEFINKNMDKIKANTNYVKDLRDKRQMNLLHCTVINDCVELISVLVMKYNIDIDDVDIDGYSSLFYAVNQKNEECLAALLSFKPRIDLITKDSAVKVTGFPIYICGGKTVLHQCAERNSIKCCQLILEYIKKSVSDKLDDMLFLKDFNGYTAMDIARMENKTKVLLLLNNFIKNNCKNAENLNDFPFNEAKRKELKREY
eukprot:204965_1